VPSLAAAQADRLNLDAMLIHHCARQQPVESVDECTYPG